jgi:hypothetical protein
MRKAAARRKPKTMPRSRPLHEREWYLPMRSLSRWEAAKWRYGHQRSKVLAGLGCALWLIRRLQKARLAR